MGLHMTPPEKVIVTRPIKSQASEANTRSVVQLRGELGWPEYVVRNVPHLDIARWRCLVECWQQFGRNVPLLWIDGDVEFLVNEGATLVALAESSGYDVLSGVYVKRGTKEPACELLKTAEPYDTNPGAPVVLDASWTHMGFTVTMPAVWRKLETLVEKPPAALSPKHGLVPMWWQSSVAENGEPIGDDVAFSFRVREAGGKIGIAPNLSVAHDGQRLSRAEVHDWATGNQPCNIS